MSGMYSVGISYAGRVITKLFFIQVLRMSGMYSVGMSYAGTGNNKAIRRLLHVAVSNILAEMIGRCSWPAHMSITNAHLS